MIQAGPWRLAKYGTGEAVLFNLDEDPHEASSVMTRVSGPSAITA